MVAKSRLRFPKDGSEKKKAGFNKKIDKPLLYNKKQENVGKVRPIRKSLASICFKPPVFSEFRAKKRRVCSPAFLNFANDNCRKLTAPWLYGPTRSDKPLFFTPTCVKNFDALRRVPTSTFSAVFSRKKPEKTTKIAEPRKHFRKNI